MRRFTILALMGLVFALAVGIAALRDANDIWAGGLMLATPLAFPIALLGALCGKERPRPGWLGFAVLGGAYFSLAFLGLSEPNLLKLPTSRLLRYVHERAAPTRFTVMLTATTMRMTGQTGGSVSVPAPTAVANPPRSVSFASTPGGPETAAVVREVGIEELNPPNRWRAFLPGAANFEDFCAVGHCLFALLAGLLGAVIAGRFERGRLAERAPMAG